MFSVNNSKTVTYKTLAIIAIVCFAIGFIAGFFVCRQWFPRTVTSPSSTQSVKVDMDGIAKITAGYVKAELAKFAVAGSQTGNTSNVTYVTSDVNDTGGTSTSVVSVPNVPTSTQQAQMKFNFAFDQFNVLANGRPISFVKDTNENFMFEKNMLDWNVGVKVTADIKLPEVPPRPEFGPYITTREAGGLFINKHKKSSDVITLTLPYRNRPANDASTLDKITIGYAHTKAF